MHDGSTWLYRKDGPLTTKIFLLATLLSPLTLSNPRNLCSKHHIDVDLFIIFTTSPCITNLQIYNCSLHYKFTIVVLKGLYTYFYC